MNSNENNLIYLLLTRGRKSEWILIGIVYWASSSRLSSFVTKSKGQSNSEDKKFCEWDQNNVTNRYTSNWKSRSCETEKTSFKKGWVNTNLTRSNFQRPCFLIIFFYSHFALTGKDAMYAIKFHRRALLFFFNALRTSSLDTIKVY